MARLPKRSTSVSAQTCTGSCASDALNSNSRFKISSLAFSSVNSLRPGPRFPTTPPRDENDRMQNDEEAGYR